jgi:hypothetical protein
MRNRRFTLIAFLLLGTAFFWLFRSADSVVPSAPLEDSPVLLVETNAPIMEEAQEVPVELPADAETHSVALITGGEATDVPWTSKTPAAHRVRRIFPNSSLMASRSSLKKGDHLTFALFDDAVFEAQIEGVAHYSNGAVGMTAHLEGDDSGVVYFSYCEQQLRVSVEVDGADDFYVRFNPETQEHYAIEVDHESSIIKNCREVMRPTPKVFSADVADSEDSTGGAVVNSIPEGATLIDVMVVYTPSARAYEGGLAGINNNIAQIMQKANEVHGNSDTQVYLRLVHSAEVAYTSSGANTDLTRLTLKDDGYLDEVHALRDEYGADFVCLLEYEITTGGLGWLQTHSSGDSEYAFCLAWVGQTAWTYTVVHEWGHNMGCSHSKSQPVQPWEFNDFRLYSAGWQWDDSLSSSDGYCSVMTYEDFGSKTYERVAHFSNPDIDYNGNATGHVANGDNARTIYEMKQIYADYREITMPVGDVDDDGLPDEWELLYFEGATAADPDALAANGVNTVFEAYIAGIDPTDSAALFNAELTDECVVRWTAVPDRAYSVQGSMNLLNGFRPLETNILWPQSSWTGTFERVRSFYKVDVQLVD